MEVEQEILEELFEGWLNGHVSYIWEYSGSICADLKELVPDIEEMALRIGLPFDAQTFLEENCCHA